jgi:integrase
MRNGPRAKGPRLWLQPERVRTDGKPNEPAVWVIRDDNRYKRSTGFGVNDRGAAERELARYIAANHAPQKRQSDPSETLILDVLGLYGRDIAPGHARPKETAARIKRLALWWGQPFVAMQTFRDLGKPLERMTGHVSDIRTSTCQTYVEYVGKARTASMDLELLRAAINHAVKDQLLERPVPVALPEKSMPRERWLTRSEVAKLVWTAWRSRRASNGISGEEDEWAMRQHVARWMLMAHYTGTRKAAILNASFQHEVGRGFIDLERGLWYRLGMGVRGTSKRQPPVPLPAPLLGHLRRWKKNGQTYPVEFCGKRVSSIDKAFRNLVRDCKLQGEPVIPHTFRHTAITWGMQRGMDPWDAAGYFGINLQTLLEVYGHHHPDHLREAADKRARPKKRRTS